MTGPEYNLSETVLSVDDYFCPSTVRFSAVVMFESCKAGRSTIYYLYLKIV